ncbi:hypothetical protein C6501_13910 [Candidatus Poribacteria bacterium]|nr:MAG: hypothetical protein C6501_13910 [Candidatus Poribacteria bacterium]
MNFSNWLEKWGMESLKITPPFLQMEWTPQAADKNAAWALYIELLTRITTQPLPIEHGDEKTALDSVYSLFATTREVIREYGPDCINFTKIAIVVLNQVIRPFTAKWHRKSIAGDFEDETERTVFRDELAALQEELRKYSQMLADIADVEDLTNLEDTEDTA